MTCTAKCGAHPFAGLQRSTGGRDLVSLLLRWLPASSQDGTGSSLMRVMHAGGGRDQQLPFNVAATVPSAVRPHS